MKTLTTDAIPEAPTPEKYSFGTTWGWQASGPMFIGLVSAYYLVLNLWAVFVSKDGEQFNWVLLTILLVLLVWASQITKIEKGWSLALKAKWVKWDSIKWKEEEAKRTLNPDVYESDRAYTNSASTFYFYQASRVLSVLVTLGGGAVLAVVLWNGASNFLNGNSPAMNVLLLLLAVIAWQLVRISAIMSSRKSASADDFLSELGKK